MSQHKWELILSIRGGHRYYRNQEGRIAVCDEEAGTESTPDDRPAGRPILWIVKAGHIEIRSKFCAVQTTYRDREIGLEEWEGFKALEYSHYAFILSERLGMPIVANDVTYTVTRKEAQ